MCYDISFSTKYELVTDYVPDLIIDRQIRFEYETSVHVVAQSFLKKPVIYKEEGKAYLKEFEWGVIADYMNTPEQVKKNRQWMCNAQSEKVFDKKSYWNRIRRTRCIIPVEGFFEHREVRGFKNKIPYFISLKDRPVFALAGLYHYAPVPDIETGEVRGTFTVVTRKANSLMEQIHNGGPNGGRMPLLLPKELELKWLEEELPDAEIKELLDFEMAPEAMAYHPVYTIRTTKERPDGKSKVEPYEWPELPALGSEGMEQAALF
ncbi:MAG TPA: SOS response-associated peptidase family protein [Flavisolibacter sp.]|jgi:putative SOS response-associated peptidase YedK|nr:SOS response-associated peptidase family protein [Flavisolibacter sp.]